jgi:hypothetical protein
MQPSWSHRVHSDRSRAIALPSAPAAQANHRGMVASLTYDSHPTVVRRHGTSQSASEPTEPDTVREGIRPSECGDGGEAASWFSLIARECAPGPQGRPNRPSSTIPPVVGRRRRPIHGLSISQTDSYVAKRGRVTRDLLRVTLPRERLTSQKDLRPVIFAPSPPGGPIKGLSFPTGRTEKHRGIGMCSSSAVRPRIGSANQRLTALPGQLGVQLPSERGSATHPYHEFRAHRCADQRFPRSLPAVDHQVMCSWLLGFSCQRSAHV